jgi:hypothetical protein
MTKIGYVLISAEILIPNHARAMMKDVLGVGRANYLNAMTLCCDLQCKTDMSVEAVVNLSDKTVLIFEPLIGRISGVEVGDSQARNTAWPDWSEGTNLRHRLTFGLIRDTVDVVITGRLVLKLCSGHGMQCSFSRSV